MKTIKHTVINHTGYTAEQYEQLKWNKYMDWILSNTKPWQQTQLALQSPALRNKFVHRWENIETRYLSHLAMFKKEQTTEGKRAVFLAYINGLNEYYPKMLNPIVRKKQDLTYSLN